MKRGPRFLIAFPLLFLLNGSLFSQSRISGIVNNEAGIPIAGATVLLLHSTDSMLVKGTVTNNAGNYLFDHIAAGEYFIASSCTGFAPVSTVPFMLQSNNENLNQRPLTLKSVSPVLANAMVIAKKPLYEQKPDRLIINVVNSIASAGNTALQILERSPGVSVNRQNNTIALFGKDGVNILMNGRLTYMPASAVVQLLDGLSAGNIEKIELITTPPANFDAEGNAGYINIVLKQNDNFGTNGSFAGTLGYGRGWVTQLNLNLNHRKERLNIFGDLSFSRVKKPFPTTLYTRISNNGNIYETFNHHDRIDTTLQQNGRLGLDYQPTNRTVIGVLLTSIGRWYTQSEHQDGSFNLNGKPDTLVTGSNSEKNNWQNVGINVNLIHMFTGGARLSFNADFLYYENNQPFHYDEQYFDVAGNSTYDEITRTGKHTPLRLWVAATDYAKKLSEKINLEAGVKGTIADFTNDVSFETLIHNNWVKNPSLSAIYTLKENYSAAYVSLDITASKKTTVKGGLRYEYTNSNLGTESVKNIVDRHYGSLFPGFMLSHRMNDNTVVNLAYSTRITRPKFSDLAPFTYYNARNLLLTGNPGLQPAIAHIVSAGISFKRYTLSLSYTEEDHTITGFQPNVDSAANKTILTPENLKNQQLLSAVLSIPVVVTKWWNMQYNITGTWQQVNAIYRDRPVKLDSKNIGLTTMQNFALPKAFSIELSGTYWSRGLDGIGVFKSFGSLDLGVRKKIGAKDAINFSASNLLNSEDFREYTNLPDQNIVGSAHLRFAWRTFKLTYSHNFGKDKVKGRRGGTTSAEDENSRAQF